MGTVCKINVSGKRLSDAPGWSGLVAADYSPHFVGYQLAVPADYAFRASRFFDLSNIALSRQGAYGLLNARVGSGPEADTGWKLEGLGRNLLD